MLEVVLKRFDKPDEIREFEKGRFEIVRLGGMTIGASDLSTRLAVVGRCRLCNRRQLLPS